LWSLKSEEPEYDKVIEILLSARPELGSIKIHTLVRDWLKRNPPSVKHYDELTHVKRIAKKINTLLYKPRPMRIGVGPPVSFIEVHPGWAIYNKAMLENAIAGFLLGLSAAYYQSEEELAASRCAFKIDIKNEK
jgi:hypothetical protein